MVKSSPPASSSRDLLILEMEFTFSALKRSRMRSRIWPIKNFGRNFFFEPPFFHALKWMSEYYTTTSNFLRELWKESPSGPRCTKWQAKFGFG